VTDPVRPERPLAEVLDEILLEEELRQIAESDPATIDKELAEAGYDAERLRKKIEAAREEVYGAPEKTAAPTQAQASKPSPAPSKVASLDAARAKRAAATRWVPLLVAAGLAATVGGGGFQYAASYRPPTTVSYPVMVPALTPEQIALRMRKAGLRACAMGYYGECQDWLDKAKALSPEPPGDKALKQARDDIEGASHGDEPGQEWELYSKPRLGPGERPLQRKP
jgi:hypothetical protein